LGAGGNEVRRKKMKWRMWRIIPHTSLHSLIYGCCYNNTRIHRWARGLRVEDTIWTLQMASLTILDGLSPTRWLISRQITSIAPATGLCRNYVLLTRFSVQCFYVLEFATDSTGAAR
jgi:hypothetical protein